MTFHVQGFDGAPAMRTSTTAGTPRSTCWSSTCPSSRAEGRRASPNIRPDRGQNPSAICGIAGGMSDTTTRALSLLNLLQTHRHWPGTELAERLGVTERTVRRDVERLRELGYRIESTPGVAGGYRLEAGSAVPPLLLNDEEAVAMAIGLRVAAAQRLVGGPETALTALAKLEQVLPAALRRRVTALADAVQPAGIRTGEAVSTEVLGELALACRDHERVRFTYTAASGEVSRRRVEPYTLAPADRHWYLLCWDLEREDWRTFRVDRVGDDRAHPRAVRAAPAHPGADRGVHPRRALVGAHRRRDRRRDGPAARRDARGLRPVGPGRDRGGRRPHAVARRRRRTSARRCTAWPGSRPAVEYTTDLAEPARAELRETLERMLRALDAAPPAPVRRPSTARHRGTHSETPVHAAGPVSGVGATVGSSRRSGRSRAPVHTWQRCGFDSRRRVHFRRAAIPVFTGIAALRVYGRSGFAHILPTLFEARCVVMSQDIGDSSASGHR